MKRLKYASAADRDHGVFGARCRFFWLLVPATAPAPAIEWPHVHPPWSSHRKRPTSRERNGPKLRLIVPNLSFNHGGGVVAEWSKAHPC